MRNQNFPYFLVTATSIAGVLVAGIGSLVIYGLLRNSDLDSQTRLVVLNAGIGIVTSGVGLVGLGVAAAGAAYQAEVKNEANSNVIVDNVGSRSEVTASSDTPNVTYDYTPQPLPMINIPGHTETIKPEINTEFPGE